MEKHSRILIPLRVPLYAILFTISRGWSVIAQDTRPIIRIAPYQASFLTHYHYGLLQHAGFLGDIMLAIRSSKRSLWYFHGQLHPQYPWLDSIGSIGTGYRQRIYPWWVIGGHLHVDKALMSYTKIRFGLEAQTRKGGISLNVYSPNVLKQLHHQMGREKKCIYIGNTARYSKMIEQDQWSGDLQGVFKGFLPVQIGLGFYGGFQRNNDAILGAMFSVEYLLNKNYTFGLKSNLDTFHGSYYSFGMQLRTPQKARGGIAKLLWQPLMRQVAPLAQEISLVDAKNHHLFFNSVNHIPNGSATFEKPSSALNEDVLSLLRPAYPTNKQVMLHLKGHFDLSCSNGHLLSLVSNENLVGEFLDSNKEKDCYQLKFLEMKVNPENWYGENPKDIESIRLLAENARLFDGRPLLKGTVMLNDHTSLRHLGFLPVPVNNQSHSLLTAISGQKKKDKRIQEVALEDIIIVGMPSQNQTFQYTYGIDITGCNNLRMDSIWINNAETAIYLNDVTQEIADKGKSPLQSIYIGSPHLAKSLHDINKMQSQISNIVQIAEDKSQDKSIRLQEAYQAFQEMKRRLSTESVSLKNLLKFIQGVDVSQLSSKVIELTLSIESKVLTGINVNNKGIESASVAFIDTKNNSVSKLSSTFTKGKQLASIFLTTLAKNEVPKKLPINDESLIHNKGKKKLTHLHIADSLVMTQGPALVIEDVFVEWVCGILSSRRLGSYVKNAELTVVGNLLPFSDIKKDRFSKDSFIYIDAIDLPEDIKKRIDSLPLLSNLSTEFKEKIPNVGCILQPEDQIVEHHVDSKEMQLKTRYVNTAIMMLVPKQNWILNQEKEIKDSDYFLFSKSYSQPIFQNNTFSLIYVSQPLKKPPAKHVKAGSTSSTRKFESDTTKLVPLQLSAATISSNGMPRREPSSKSARPASPIRSSGSNGAGNSSKRKIIPINPIQ